MDSGTSFSAALIGDVVASREASDRGALQRALETALAEVNARTEPVQPLRPSVGDEFQGVWASVPEAVHAALLVRLELLPEVDTRFGIGTGSITMLDAARNIQDGPAWWAARAGIEYAERASREPATRYLRTWVGTNEPTERLADGTSAAAVFNVGLTCQDYLIATLDERSLRLLRGMMRGSVQSELAALEGISQPAVSRRIAADGLAAIRAAQLELLAAGPERQAHSTGDRGLTDERGSAGESS